MDEYNQNGAEGGAAQQTPTVTCVCTVCGREMVPDSMFCTVCGAPVVTTRIEPPKPPEPPKPKKRKQPKQPKQPMQNEQTMKYVQRALIALAACVAVCVVAFVSVKVVPGVILPFVRDVAEETGVSKVKVTDVSIEDFVAEATAAPVITPTPTVEPVKNTLDTSRIDSIIAMDANNANIGVCIYDIKNKTYYHTGNSARKMSASALINIPILYMAEQSLKNNIDTWSSMVRFKYMYSGREIIKSSQNGNSYELRYLLEKMLGYSDNNITNSLIDYWGSSYIETVCAQNGYNSVEIQKYLGEVSQTRDNYISADDVVDMLREMYESGRYIDDDYLKMNLCIEDGAKSDGLGKYLPSGITFLNHNALTSTIYNEVGIVISDKAEYIIAVLTNNGNCETSSNTVAQISDYVYWELNK